MYAGWKTAGPSGQPGLVHNGGGICLPLEHVMPQFTCHHPGCGVVFAAKPGLLDWFLTHITRRRKEEAAARVPLGQRHPFLPNTDAGMLKPNPYYKPPNKHNEVP